MSMLINRKSDSMTIARRIGIAAAAAAAAVVLFPATALAVPMNITQTAESGDNPASTIIITTDDGTEVGRYEYAGGDATVDLPDDLENKIEAGGTYYVTAEAPGYTFNTQGGQVNEQGANVSLVARRAVSVVVTLSAEGVSDYSGVSASLYEGSSATGTPRAQADTDASGKITFENVPAGTYTLQLTLPDSLEGVLPVTTSITVPADPTETVNVTVEGTPAESATNENDNQAENEATNENANENAEANENENTEQPAAANATVVDDTEISQTGAMAGYAIAGVAVAGAAVAGGVALYKRHKDGK